MEDGHCIISCSLYLSLTSVILKTHPEYQELHDIHQLYVEEAGVQEEYEEEKKKTFPTYN